MKVFVLWFCIVGIDGQCPVVQKKAYNYESQCLQQSNQLRAMATRGAVVHIYRQCHQVDKTAKPVPQAPRGVHYDA